MAVRKFYKFLLLVLVLVSCSKHDPILPGERHDIFGGTDVKVLGKTVPHLSESAKEIYGDKSCDFTQDATNTIWHGDKKVFKGFATGDSVQSNQKPICVGNFIYTGLSNGEIVKLNTINNRIVWTADVYKENTLTGGYSIVDVIARVGIDNGFVYAGGLGDAFCKLKNTNGDKVWCVNISVPVDFILIDDFAFVVGGDNNLYALDVKDGSVYWKTKIKKQKSPKYDGKYIVVGKEKIDYTNGQIR